MLRMREEYCMSYMYEAYRMRCMCDMPVIIFYLSIDSKHLIKENFLSFP